MTPEIITPDLLLQAYAAGIFPMADSQDDPTIHWVDPRQRGIIPLDGFHLSRSLARRIEAGGYAVTLDRDFAGVVDGCADRERTWINAEIRSLYIALHAISHAHSIEVWHNGALIGGVYGVVLGAAFFGESMFSRRVDGSKTALAYLVHHLAHQGFALFDTQFLTPHLASLGGIEIPRADYQRRLRAAIAQPARFTPDAYPPDPSSVTGFLRGRA